MDTKHLGHSTVYPKRYAPEVLEAIPRGSKRETIGYDLWQAYELTWLSDIGQPQVSGLTLTIDAETESIVESKSLKLYLQSMHFEQFKTPKALESRIQTDLSHLLGQGVEVRLMQPAQQSAWLLDQELHAAGQNLDHLTVACTTYAPDSQLLQLINNPLDDPHPSQSQLPVVVNYTEAFRSLCPVTSQPDLATIIVYSQGIYFEPTSLVKYFASFRDHQGFHEQCIERMYKDLHSLLESHKPKNLEFSLGLIGRFTRRGGIDINPVRFTANLRNQLNFLKFNQRQWRQ